MSWRALRSDVLALAVLAAAVLLVYSRVLFTNLVPAGGDSLFYFIPYWQQVNQALGEGRLPLWNPYLFAGAPFLANLQASVFYPLRWPLILVDAAKGIVYAAAFHAWLAGALGYALARRSAGVRPAAGLVVGLILALNGWTTGMLAHPNRAATLPWLLAALVAWESVSWKQGWGVFRRRRSRRWLAAAGVVWALAVLAGHTQTFYNQAVIFAAWALAAPVWRLGRALRHSTLTARWVWTQLGPTLAALAGVFGLAVALGAVQLLPTYELSTLSYRSGGLPYRDHAALSLPPWRLGFALLPHYARDLGQALSTDAYAEWVGYVGLAGLALAFFGLVSGLARPIRLRAAVLVGLGALLAIGAYGPLDYVLYAAAPGWSLFRVPARWWHAVVLGLALLAGLGMERLFIGPPWPAVLGRNRRKRLIAIAAGVLLLALAAFTSPNFATLAGWSLALGGMAAALYLVQRKKRWAPLLVVGLLLAELAAASFVLPIQHPTAPQAITSWRTAPSRIAAEGADDAAAGPCRTLSLSRTTYDPGDLGALRSIYGPFLDERAFNDLVVATKAKEVLAPNLSMLAGLPTLDGFDGGLLPTGAFVKAMGLFLPEDLEVADGRLRELMHEVPDPRLLSLFGVCYVITDKDFDVWQDDVYYDLVFGEALTAAQPELHITRMPVFPAAAIGLVSHLQDGAGLSDGETVAELVVTYREGGTVTLPIRAGLETFTGADDPPGLAHRRDLPSVRWRYDAPGHDAIAQVPLPQAGPISSVDVRLLRPDTGLFVRGMAVLDEATGAHSTPVVSRHPWTRIHSGDVKVYQNNGVLPHAFLARRAEEGADDDAAAARLADPDFPVQETVLLPQGSPDLAEADLIGASVEWLESQPERSVLRVRTPADAWLVVADAWYPGWTARIDGAETPILRADLLLRAIQTPAGDHIVEFDFAPTSLRWGLIISLAALVGVAALFMLRDS